MLLMTMGQTSMTKAMMQLCSFKPWLWSAISSICLIGQHVSGVTHEFEGWVPTKYRGCYIALTFCWLNARNDHLNVTMSGVESLSCPMPCTFHGFSVSLAVRFWRIWPRSQNSLLCHAIMQRMSGFPATNDVLTGPNRPAVRSWKRPVDALELELGTCMSWLPWLRWHPLGSIWACGSIQWVLIMWRIYMDLLSPKLWSHLCNESPSYRTHQNSTIHHGILRHSLIFFSMPRWYQQRQGRGLSELRNGGKWINLKVLNVLRCIETHGISRQRRCTRMPRFLYVFVAHV